MGGCYFGRQDKSCFLKMGRENLTRSQPQVQLHFCSPRRYYVISCLQPPWVVWPNWVWKLVSSLVCIKLESTNWSQGIGCKSLVKSFLMTNSIRPWDRASITSLEPPPHRYPDVTPAAPLFVRLLRGCDIMFVMAAAGGIRLVAEQESASN